MPHPPEITLPSSHKIHQIEALRGLMALWVWLSHILYMASYKSAAPLLILLSSGGLAVQVFMVISGFVITLHLSTVKQTYRNYLFHRFMRLYPVYLLCLLLGILAAPHYPEIFLQPAWAAPTPDLLTRTQVEHDYFWGHLLAHLTLLHGMVPPDILPQSQLALLSSAWSLSLEWQFYLAAPLMLSLLFLRPSLLWTPLFFLASYIARYVSLDILHMYLIPAFLPQSLTFFLVGMAYAYFWPSLRAATAKTQSGLTLLVMALAIMLAPNYQAMIPYVIWALVAWACLTPQHAFATRINGFLTHPAALWLGRSSYSLYLVHVPVMVLTGASLLHYWPDMGQFPFMAALFAITAPLCLLLASLMYRYVERPGIRLGKILMPPASLAGSRPA